MIDKEPTTMGLREELKAARERLEEYADTIVDFDPGLTKRDADEIAAAIRLVLGHVAEGLSPHAGEAWLVEGDVDICWRKGKLNYASRYDPVAGVWRIISGEQLQAFVAALSAPPSLDGDQECSRADLSSGGPSSHPITDGGASLEEPTFAEFPKMARFSREIIITEKIDGTNAQVWISDDGTEIRAGSRNRWLTLADDNFGFAKWVADNRDELLTLGPGRHFGEWWGSGIQRRYGLTEKRFSLFNVSRWGDERPACCHVVPTLYRGPFREPRIEAAILELKGDGSMAAPGFMKPEGIVIFHVAANIGFKKTIEKDEVPKSLAAKAEGTPQ